MKKLIILLVVLPSIVFAQFTSTTTKQIDTIINNTGTDITINPTNKVVIPYLNAGDIVYNDSGVTGLAIGTLGQLLSVSALGFPEWIDIPDTSPLTTKGDLYTYDTDNQRLAVGTDAQILSANSATATGLEWIDAPSSSPTTTEGDLILRGASEDERLAIGTSDQVLTSNGTTASWQDVVASPSFTTITVTTNYTPAIIGEDNIVMNTTSGDISLVMPTAVGNNGLTYKIVKFGGTNIATLNPNSTETIGGSLTLDLVSDNDSVIATSNGSDWELLSYDVQERCQTNTLSADVTTDTADITDLKFSNLIIGARYQVILSADMTIQNGDATAALDILHGGANFGSVVGGNQAASPISFSAGQTTKVFTATATTVTFRSLSILAGTVIKGNNATSETHATLCTSSKLDTTEF